ncbi:MAG TPA: folate-binding protein [Candidatus Didemnitutus sp.]|nr:folate-binding protein [Candidatus Didemnitutus sp.]
MPFQLHISELKETSAAFSISGPDANTYLQGQLTQELRGPIGSASYGLWLTQKGKVLADSMVLRKGENEFRVVSFSISAAVLKERIESYLIADDVTVVDESSEWERISVWAEGAAKAVAAVLGEAPGLGKFVETTAGFGFPGRIGAESFELLVPAGAGEMTAQKLAAASVHSMDAAAAEAERIRAGIPAIPIDIGPNDLPNEGGLDDVAISYTKGCYLGQEIMARLKNLGQVRRRLHVIRGVAPAPATSDALYQNGKRVGDVRTVARGDDGFFAMAMLSLVNLDPSRSLSLSAEGPAEIQVVRRV